MSVCYYLQCVQLSGATACTTLAHWRWCNSQFSVFKYQHAIWVHYQAGIQKPVQLYCSVVLICVMIPPSSGIFIIQEHFCVFFCFLASLLCEKNKKNNPNKGNKTKRQKKNHSQKNPNKPKAKKPTGF